MRIIFVWRKRRSPGWRRFTPISRAVNLRWRPGATPSRALTPTSLISCWQRNRRRTPAKNAGEWRTLYDLGGQRRGKESYDARVCDEESPMHR